MEFVSQNMIEVINTVSVSLQIFFIALFSFSEGLPIVGSFLPGGTIAIFAGSIATEGFFSPFFIAVLVSVASFMGDTTGFFIGRKFRNFKWVQEFAVHEKHKRSWDLFDRHMALIAIFGRLVPVVRSAPSLFAAIRGVRTRRYVVYSFLGSCLWAFSGVYFGNMITNYFGQQVISIIFGVVLVSIGIIIVRYLLKKIK